MKWQTLKSSYPFKSKWLTVRKDHVRMPLGHEMDDFYVVESPDWVNVIAITKDGQIVLERQYRHGLQQICIEIPAGSVEPSESALDAGKRELLDETGYSGGEWIPFGNYAPNASGMNNLSHTFIANGVEKIGKPCLEISEDIEVFLASKEELKELLESEQIIEADLMAPLWRYLYRI